MRIFIFMVFFVGFFSAFAQKTIPNSFKITNNEHPEKELTYIQNIEKSNFENYRLKDKDVTVHFENGFDCVLFSAKSLFQKGVQVNPGNYLDVFPKEYRQPKFNMLNDGNIYAIYAPVGKFK